MVVSDPTKALMILGERGVLALENDVLMIESNNKPGMLSTIAERLAKASINIEYAYLASTRKRGNRAHDSAPFGCREGAPRPARSLSPLDSLGGKPPGQFRDVIEPSGCSPNDAGCRRKFLPRCAFSWTREQGRIRISSEMIHESDH